MLEDRITDDEDLEDEDLDSSGQEGVPLKERLRLKTDKRQEPLRIDKFLMNRVEGATRNKLQQAIENGMVLVNGEAVKPNHKIKAGDEIVVFDTRKVESTDIIPEQMDLDIRYEDEDLIVIHKPAGLVVHPGSGNYSGTLVNGIAWYLNPEEDKQRIIDLPRVGLVHRIDKNTSGLLLIGKSEVAMKKLAAQFKAHTVHRRYIGLAWGDIEADSGTVDVPVGRNLRFRKKMDTFPDGEQGKQAITHYRVLERFHYVTLLEFRLETGRTHQIRVHARHLGHPLFNDETYGGDRIVKGTVYAKYKQFVENAFKLMPRHALHAKELGFRHPRSGEVLHFDSALPADFSALIEKWRKYIQHQQ